MVQEDTGNKGETRDRGLNIADIERWNTRNCWLGVEASLHEGLEEKRRGR
jgi:hypothetical protein